MGLVSYAWQDWRNFWSVILFSLYWKRMNKWGAFAGLIFGGLTTVLWKFAHHPLYEIVPGFIVATVAIILFSLLTKKPTSMIEKEFEHISLMN